MGFMGLMAMLSMPAGCGRQRVEVKADSGQEIYIARCVVCHGENEEGRAGMQPALAGAEFVSGPPERLAAIILDGMQGRVGSYEAVMPGWRTVLNDAEIAAVMTWLRRREGKGPVPPVEVNHVRIETEARNTFWTADDLRALRMH